MSRKKKFKPVEYTADEMRAALATSIGKTPIKMQDLAFALGLTEEGQSVPSAVGARLRVQLNKLLGTGAIEREGERATTRYSAKSKAKKKAPKKKTA